MRVPYQVSNNVKEVYHTSGVMANSPAERDRTLVAEDFEWNTGFTPLPLTEWAAIALSRVFDRVQPLKVILQKDIDILMDLYPADIPLRFSVPHIKDEQYWKRSFATKWPQRKELGVDCWKAKFLSVAVQEYLEKVSADVFVTEEAEELATLVAPYIFSLSLWQLQIVRPPTIGIPSEDAVEDTCPFSVPPRVDHIPLETVLRKLYNLVEISIVFGVNNLEEKYNARYFEFSLADCESLCKGLADLQHLKIFRINRSNLDCPKVKLILQYLVKKKSLEELDFAHCTIGNAGVKALAGFIYVHPGLRVMRLPNNKFDEFGVQGLAYALQMKPAAPLEILDLRLNTMTANSSRLLASSLVRCKEKPQHLIVSACGLYGESAQRMVGLLCLNRGLTDLDLSANDLSGEAETTLIEALERNRRVLRVDLRNTRISESTQERVDELLSRNMKLVDQDTEASEEIPPLYLNQPEYLVWDYNPDNPDHEPGRYPVRVPEV